MWIFSNDAFLSVVAAQPGSPGHPDDGRDWMCVRARCIDDLERVFGTEVNLLVDAGTDYKYRCYVLREVLHEAMRQEIDRITYLNFKNSVGEHERHSAYMDVWDAMYTFQQRLTRARKA